MFKYMSHFFQVNGPRTIQNLGMLRTTLGWKSQTTETLAKGFVGHESATYQLVAKRLDARLQTLQREGEAFPQIVSGGISIELYLCVSFSSQKIGDDDPSMFRFGFKWLKDKVCGATREGIQSGFPPTRCGKGGGEKSLLCGSTWPAIGNTKYLYH